MTIGMLRSFAAFASFAAIPQGFFGRDVPDNLQYADLIIDQQKGSFFRREPGGHCAAMAGSGFTSAMVG